MNDVIEVRFQTSGEAASRTLIHEYVLDAIDRLSDTESVEAVSFLQHTHGPPDQAIVSLNIVGDTDEVINRESDRWDELTDAGLTRDWSTTDYTEMWEQQYGERSLELRLRLSNIANEASAAAFEEFADAPAIVDAYPEEESAHPIGWYTLLHQLTLQQGYSVDEELDAYVQLIDTALENLKHQESDEYVNERIDEIVEMAESTRPESSDKSV